MFGGSTRVPRDQSAAQLRADEHNWGDELGSENRISGSDPSIDASRSVQAFGRRVSELSGNISSLERVIKSEGSIFFWVSESRYNENLFDVRNSEIEAVIASRNQINQIYLILRRDFF